MQCHICDANYRVKHNGIFQCDNCGHTHQKFDGNAVFYHKNIYRKQRFHQRSNKEFDTEGNVTPHFHEARNNICQDRLQLIENYINTEQTCLDVGAGAGTFAKILSPRVKNVHCLEICDVLINECRSMGFLVYDEDFTSTQTINVKYDCIFAWHVLEHIEDVNAFMEKCTCIGKDGFLLFIEVPYKRKLKKEYDGHTHHFCEKSLKHLIEKFNYKILELKEGVQKPALFAVSTIPIREKNELPRIL